jgi:pimeloyl-ACP methyl ester carboxylesterase
MLANAAAIDTELGAGTGEHIDRDGLAAIRAPVTLLVGSDSDPVFGAAARRLASFVEHAELREVGGAGHLLQRDRPDAVAAAVRSVLGPAAVSPRARP